MLVKTLLIIAIIILVAVLFGMLSGDYGKLKRWLENKRTNKASGVIMDSHQAKLDEYVKQSSVWLTKRVAEAQTKRKTKDKGLFIGHYLAMGQGYVEKVEDYLRKHEDIEATDMAYIVKEIKEKQKDYNRFIIDIANEKWAKE